MNWNKKTNDIDRCQTERYINVGVDDDVTQFCFIFNAFYARNIHLDWHHDLIVVDGISNENKK